MTGFSSATDRTPFLNSLLSPSREGNTEYDFTSSQSLERANAEMDFHTSVLYTFSRKRRHPWKYGGGSDATAEAVGGRARAMQLVYRQMALFFEKNA